MIHLFEIEGMTCSSCVSNVSNALKKVPGVKSIDIDIANKAATIEMYRHIPETELQQALGNSKYFIREKIGHADSLSFLHDKNDERTTEEKSDFQRLYPLFLIFAYLSGIVVLAEMMEGSWDGMRTMKHFMGGFFLIFSFFKMLDLRAFASSFSMYDPLAKSWPSYGYSYPFIELGLGIGILLNFNLQFLSLLTVVLLGISTIGVAKTVFNKKKIQCACLGTVFNLPMTKVTLIENSVMIAMAIGMLVVL